ncbi:NAC domain-containing protein [Tanacetum coccineum]
MDTPTYVVTEGNEPPFFTRFFEWDASKANMLGNTFERQLAILKGQSQKLEVTIPLSLLENYLASVSLIARHGPREVRAEWMSENIPPDENIEKRWVETIENLEGSDDYTEVTLDEEQCLFDHYSAPVIPSPLAYTPSIPENDEFIKSSVDNLVPIPRESELTSDREHLDTLSTGDKEIDFNPSKDIEELERLLVDDPVPVPRVFDAPLVGGNVEGDGDPSFGIHHMPSPRLAYIPRLTEVQGIENKAKTVTFGQDLKKFTHEMQSKIDSMMINLGNPTPEPLVNSCFYEESDDDIKVTPAYTPFIPFLATMEPTNTLIMGDEVISTTPAREYDDFIKSSIDDLVLILRESEVTSNSNLECDMPTPFPTTDVREEVFDINSPLGEQVVNFLMENVDVAGLPRHLVKRLFSYLLKSLTKGMSDEPLGDDSKPRSYDVTFSNPLFDFNDDSTLCNDNPLFDEEFENISSLDPSELTPVIDESTLLVTLPVPCNDVLGDVIVDNDLPLGEPLDTFSTGDWEIDFNPSKDIEELERLLADDHVPAPRVFDAPLGNSFSIPRSSETSDLFEELIAEIVLDDSIPIRIDDRYYDSEGDILFFEQLLNEDTSSNASPALLPTESSSLILPLPDPRISYDLEDLRACFQSSNHAVSAFPLAFETKHLLNFKFLLRTENDRVEYKLDAKRGVVGSL